MTSPLFAYEASGKIFNIKQLWGFSLHYQSYFSSLFSFSLRLLSPYAFVVSEY